MKHLTEQQRDKVIQDMHVSMRGTIEMLRVRVQNAERKVRAEKFNKKLLDKGLLVTDSGRR